MLTNTTYECFLQGWSPRGLSSSSRTLRGQNLVALALASNLSGLGLDAVLFRLGVLVSVAGIYANVIRAIAKIHLVPIVLLPSRLVLATTEMSTYRPIAMLTA
jgi:hypothetical protein